MSDPAQLDPRIRIVTVEAQPRELEAISCSLCSGSGLDISIFPIDFCRYCRGSGRLLRVKAVKQEPRPVAPIS